MIRPVQSVQGNVLRGLYKNMWVGWQCTMGTQSQGVKMIKGIKMVKADLFLKALERGFAKVERGIWRLV